MSILSLKNWRDYPDGREKYSLYLASRDWALLKEGVRARSGGKCERCRNADGEQVHHQTYERKYAEPLEDLVHLCAPCHEFISGKRSGDPVLEAPPRLLGRPVQNVYLAGKITGTTWRDEIVHRGWSRENSSAIDFDLSDGIWQPIERCLPIPDGRRLNLTGPFWRPAFNCGGHGRIKDARGSHCFAQGFEGPHEADPECDLYDLLWQIHASIHNADLVFAWVDSHDCYGTLTEIGYAKGLGRLVVVFAKKDLDSADLWLPFHTANIRGTATSPQHAWHVLWTEGPSEPSKQ